MFNSLLPKWGWDSLCPHFSNASLFTLLSQYGAHCDRKKETSGNISITVLNVWFGVLCIFLVDDDGDDDIEPFRTFHLEFQMLYFICNIVCSGWCFKNTNGLVCLRSIEQLVWYIRLAQHKHLMLYFKHHTRLFAWKCAAHCAHTFCRTRINFQFQAGTMDEMVRTIEIAIGNNDARVRTYGSEKEIAVYFMMKWQLIVQAVL